MNKRIDFTHIGGMPYDLQTFDFMQSSYRDAFAAFARFAGDKVILNGVTVVGSNVSGGWICFDGEMIPFIGGGLATDVVIEETATPLTFADQAVHPVEFTKIARCGTPGTFPFAQLTRLGTLKAERWQTGDIKMINCDAAYIAANFDAFGIGINDRIGWKICTVMNGRSPVGYDPNDPEFNIEVAAGAKTHTLSVAELPAHNHSIATRGGVGSTVANTLSNYDTATDVADVNTASAGSGQPHNNMHPYKVVLFIEKL